LRTLPHHEGGPCSLAEGSGRAGEEVEGALGNPLIVKDMWGSPYEYISLSPNQFELTSYGADAIPGGEGDNADIVVNE
jgi:general secretion pathway protein G